MSAVCPHNISLVRHISFARCCADIYLQGYTYVRIISYFGFQFWTFVWGHLFSRGNQKTGTPFFWDNFFLGQIKKRGHLPGTFVPEKLSWKKGVPFFEPRKRCLQKCKSSASAFARAKLAGIPIAKLKVWGSCEATTNYILNRWCEECEVRGKYWFNSNSKFTTLESKDCQAYIVIIFYLHTLLGEKKYS